MVLVSWVCGVLVGVGLVDDVPVHVALIHIALVYAVLVQIAARFAVVVLAQVDHPDGTYSARGAGLTLYP